MKMNSQMDNLPAFLNNDPLLCPEKKRGLIVKYRGFGDLGETREHVVPLAAKHVSAARSQKFTAQAKVEATSEQSIGIVNPNKKTIALVIDYC